MLRAGISGLLQKNTVAKLRDIAVQNGVLTAGKKQELADRLANHFIVTHKQKPSTNVLSFDLGYRNLAYCRLDKDAKILDWARIDLELPSFHPSVVAPIVRDFLADRVTPNLPGTDTVLVEQQRARSNGSHTVLEHTLRVNCVESILWCGLYEARDKHKHIMMTPVPRQTVDRVWQPELDQVALENPQQFARLKKGTYHKKRATTLLVQKWIETNSVIDCSQEFKDMFHEEKKKDDLSDCLLQALTWFQWEKHTRDFINQHLLE